MLRKIEITNSILMALATALLVTGTAPALAQEWTLDEEQRVEQPPPYSPFVDQYFPQQVFFGDTHHHSALSVDSGLIGNRNGPEVSFRFARGEEMRTSHG